MKQIRNFAGVAAALLAAGTSYADDLNMPVGVTDISQQVYDLHMTILWICVWIGGVVYCFIVCHCLKLDKVC